MLRTLGFSKTANAGVITVLGGQNENPEANQ
jgi:hypothetical protein